MYFLFLVLFLAPHTMCVSDAGYMLDMFPALPKCMTSAVKFFFLQFNAFLTCCATFFSKLSFKMLQQRRGCHVDYYQSRSRDGAGSAVVSELYVPMYSKSASKPCEFSGAVACC